MTRTRDVGEVLGLVALASQEHSLHMTDRSAGGAAEAHSGVVDSDSAMLRDD